MPRPYGGGRVRGRGSYNNRGHNNERQDGASGWGSGWGSAATKDKDDSLSNFPGAKVQNSPGREAFPGGWGGGASTGDKSGWGGGANTGDKSGWGGGNGWGGGASTGAEHGNSGWGSGSKKAADIGWSGN